MRRRPIVLAILAACAFAVTVRAAQQTPPAAERDASPLSLEELTIDPAVPGPATLCKLRVKVRNGGTQVASRLGFAVKINGQVLLVYANQLYLQDLPAGQLSEVRLYNFWTTETTRPLPKDGKLTVEVALQEASWVEVKTEQGVEVSRPLGPVPGLPVAKSLTVTLKK